MSIGVDWSVKLNGELIAHTYTMPHLSLVICNEEHSGKLAH